jgi:hypothetical protein
MVKMPIANPRNDRISFQNNRRATGAKAGGYVKPLAAAMFSMTIARDQIGQLSNIMCSRRERAQVSM